MSYPDVVIVRIEHKVSLEAFRAIEAALVKHDNNMKDYFLGGWLITITANHSNYLVQTEPTRSLSLSESGKTATQLLQCLPSWNLLNIVLFEESIADVYLSITLMMYMPFLTLVSFRRQASMTRLRNSWPFLLKSAMLICLNSFGCGADVAGCCSGGFCLCW